MPDEVKCGPVNYESTDLADIYKRQETTLICARESVVVTALDAELSLLHELDEVLLIALKVKY